MLFDVSTKLPGLLHLPLLLSLCQGHGLLRSDAQALPVGVLTLQALPETDQVLHAAPGTLPLGSEGRLPGLFLRQPGRQLTEALPAVRLLLLKRLRFGPGGFRPGGKVRNGPANGVHPSGVIAAALLQVLLLNMQTLLLALQAVQQNIKVVLAALQGQHPVIGPALLVLGHLQLILGLLQLPVGALGHKGCVLKLGLDLLALFLQLLQLPGAGENPRITADAAAGHRAAGVDDLAIQGDDAEAVVVALGHLNAAVQVLHHHGSAQKVLHNGTIFPLVAHQFRRNAHEAVLVFQAVFPETAALDGVQRQEGCPASVPLL